MLIGCFQPFQLCTRKLIFLAKISACTFTLFILITFRAAIFPAYIIIASNIFRKYITLQNLSSNMAKLALLR